MFYSRKPDRNWLLLSTALLGGFALGVSYKKFGPQLSSQIRRATNRNYEFEDYMTSHEPDA